MSEKKRRDITLGEMQDECKFRGDNCETVGGDKCKFFEICAVMQTIDKGCLTPIMWDLTDPPRFNEAQMAFFRGLHGLGVAKLDTCVKNGQPTAFGVDGDIFWYDFLDGVEFPLDLAELLGKDGESK